MANLQVVKREGGQEDWSMDKLVTSITKSGVELEEAKQVAALVESWALRSSANGQISWSQIRDKVTQFLRVVDPVAASAYESYKK